MAYTRHSDAEHEPNDRPKKTNFHSIFLRTVYPALESFTFAVNALASEPAGTNST
jgi:hypothetical protein